MNLRDHLNIVEASTQLEEIKLKPLSYPLYALEPCMTMRNVQVHYDILTKKYFKKYAETGDLFQKAGAVLHNDYYWPMLRPYDKNNSPSKKTMEKIEESHGDFKQFKENILEKATRLQGSGWVFVMEDLQIQMVQNHLIKPGIIMGIDLWEHQTVDYKFDREEFLKEFWYVINWEIFEKRMLENQG